MPKSQKGQGWHRSGRVDRAYAGESVSVLSEQQKGPPSFSSKAGWKVLERKMERAKGKGGTNKAHVELLFV